MKAKSMNYDKLLKIQCMKHLVYIVLKTVFNEKHVKTAIKFFFSFEHTSAIVRTDAFKYQHIVSAFIRLLHLLKPYRKDGTLQTNLSKSHSIFDIASILDIRLQVLHNIEKITVLFPDILTQP